MNLNHRPKLPTLALCLSFIIILTLACQSQTQSEGDNEGGGQPTPQENVSLSENNVPDSMTPAPTVGGAAVGTPTHTPLPTATATFVPSPTPHTLPLPLPTPMDPLIDYYVVKSGDTLSGISFAYDVSIEDLMALNGLDAETAVIQIGQTLHVPLQVSRTGPILTLLPDSEVVYSPAYLDFDVAAFLQAQGGQLATASARVDGEELAAAQIVTLVARRFGVGPRVLLALLEYYTGRVTNPAPDLNRLAGAANPYRDNLYLELGWLANRVNEGFYGYKRSGSTTIRFRDGSRAIIPAGLNAGTAGIQNALAVNSNWDAWQTEVSAQGFILTYQTLFGDPFAHAIEPQIPIDLSQPPLTLPWEANKTFYYTGGPHPAYGDGSGWAAIDFGPPDVLGNCFYSGEYITAVADGRIFMEGEGHIYLDLDADGNLQTGWVLLYLHVVAKDDLSDGAFVNAGTPLGYASCEGGRSNSSHLHLARRYNGEWIAAGGPVPMVLSGWEVKRGLGQYEGGMVKGTDVKTACECWDEEENAIINSE